MLVMHSSFWLLLLALTTTADLYAAQDDSRYYLSRYGGEQDRCPRCDRGNGYDNLGYGLAPGVGRPSVGWGDGRPAATGSHAAGWGLLSSWKKDWDSRNSAGRDHGPSYYGNGSGGQWQDRLPRPAGGWDDRGASGGRWDDRGVSGGRWDDKGVSSEGRPGWSSWDIRGDRGGVGGNRWDDRRPSGGGRWDERYPTSGGRWDERYPTGAGRWDDRGSVGGGRWDERQPAGAGGGRWDERQPAGVGGGRWDERQPSGAGGGKWDERQPVGAGGGRWDERYPTSGGRWDERQPGGAGGGRWDERGVVGGGGRWYERWDDRRPSGGGRWVELGYVGSGRYDGRDPDRGYASGWDYGHAATRPPLHVAGTGSSSWHDHAGSGSGADRPCEPTRVHYKEYHYGGGGEERDRRPAKPWPTSYLSYLYDRNTSAADLGSGEAPSTSPPDTATAKPASAKT